PDWPGLERGAKTGDAAIERLQSYLPRYARVAKLAGMDAEFAAITSVDVVEHYPGSGSTDFWGISFAFSGIDRQVMSREALARDREHIVRHTFGTEQEWVGKIGVLTPPGAMLTDAGLNAHRVAYCEAIREFHSQGKMARSWPLRFLMRHTAFHTMDHAWEMED